MKLKSAARILFNKGAVQQSGAETALKQISHPASNIQPAQFLIYYYEARLYIAARDLCFLDNLWGLPIMFWPLYPNLFCVSDSCIFFLKVCVKPFKDYKWKTKSFSCKSEYSKPTQRHAMPENGHAPENVCLFAHLSNGEMGVNATLTCLLLETVFYQGLQRTGREFHPMVQQQSPQGQYQQSGRLLLHVSIKRNKTWWWLANKAHFDDKQKDLKIDLDLTFKWNSLIITTSVSDQMRKIVTMWIMVLTAGHIRAQ